MKNSKNNSSAVFKKLDTMADLRLEEAILRGYINRARQAKNLTREMLARQQLKETMAKQAELRRLSQEHRRKLDAANRETDPKHPGFTGPRFNGKGAAK